jgi:hypothetical protein
MGDGKQKTAEYEDVSAMFSAHCKILFYAIVFGSLSMRLTFRKKHYFQFYFLILKMEALNLPETLEEVYSSLAWPKTI